MLVSVQDSKQRFTQIDRLLNFAQSPLPPGHAPVQTPAAHSRSSSQSLLELHSAE